MPFETGPFLQAACFAEQVIEDKSGVISLIRIIDTITRGASGPEVPDEMPPFTFGMKLVLMIKSGEAHGRHEIRIRPEEPSGLHQPPVSLPVHLEGGIFGTNLVNDFHYTFEQEGTYWFRIYFDDEFWTSIPFRVRYQPITTTRPPQ
jgi:hypothetical protein